VPTFTGLLTKNAQQAAWKLASAVINWVFIVAATVSLLAFLFAPQIVRYVLAPGFVDDPVKFQMTVQLMHINLISVVIFAVSGLVMGILNAHQSFLFPALAPAMYSLGQIFGVLVLAPVLGIFGLAWGVVIGAALHLLIQVPKLLRLGGSYFPELGIHNADVREVGWLMLPRLVGVSIVQINFWVNINLASRYTEGSATAIQYGFALMLLPLNFIAQAIATASLPTFSEQYALGKTDEMRNSISSAIRSILLLSIPASMGLIILRFPLIRFLYEGGGAFTAQDTQLVAWALMWYAAGLVGHSVLEIVVRAFYAQHDTKTPVMVGTGAMALNIGLSILLAWFFNRIGWMPHGGLALANSLATALEVSILLWLMRKRLSGIGGGGIWASLWRSLMAAAGMGAALLGFLTFGQDLSSLMQLLGGLVMGVAVYGGTAYLLKIEELTVVMGMIKRKVFGKR
jgi:putative peptidoglycan lipid II flippase